MQGLYAIALHTFSLIAASLFGQVPKSVATLIDHESTRPDWQFSCPVQNVNYLERNPLPTCAARSHDTHDSALPLTTATSLWSVDSTGRSPTLSEEVTVVKTPVSGTLELDSTISSRKTSSSPSQTSPPSSSISDVSPEPSPIGKEEAEGDSTFDLTSFLSFEEWKQQNLAKAGQSAENVGQRTVKQGSEGQGRPYNSNGLDSYGDDAEIDIDFSGFGKQQAKSKSEEHPNSDRSEKAEGIKPDAEEENTKDKTEATVGHPRSKDAGKTCKERSNYASFDCAATVLKTNPECKGVNSILVENKDSYMLNKCAANNKFFIVELCNDILIDTIVLANYEFFSSMFRTFRVSVSDRYPVKLDKWKEVGVYEARNTREIQAFLVENPLIWAKYIRVEFLSQYGNEYYCPVSLFRVHGTTMMEEFNHDMKVSRGEEEAEGESEDEILQGDPKATVANPILTTTRDMTSSSVNDSDQSKPPKTASSEAGDVFSSAGQITPPSRSSLEQPHAPVCESLEQVLFKASSSKTPSTEQPNRDQTSQSLKQASPSVIIESSEQASPTPSERSKISSSPSSNAHTTKSHDYVIAHSVQPSSKDTTNSDLHPSVPPNLTSPLSSTPASTPVSSMNTSTSDTGHPSAAVTNISNTLMSATTTNSPSSSSSLSSSAKTSSMPKAAPSSSPPPTQESFFKSVHKRIQLLESNSTLSLQYIESQSLLLRDAFSRFEKRQINKTTSFLETLNATVLGELRSFRHQYETLLMESIRGMGAQSLDAQKQIQLLTEGLKDVKRDMYWQQRIAVLQFTALIMGLGFVFLSRQISSPMSHMNGRFPDHYQSGQRMYANGCGPDPDTTTAAAAYETPPSSASQGSTSPRFSWLRRGSPPLQNHSPPLKRLPLKREKTLPALPPNDGLPSPSPTPSPEPFSTSSSSGRGLTPPIMANGENWPLQQESPAGSNSDDQSYEHDRLEGIPAWQANGSTMVASDADEEMRRPQSGPI